MKSLSEFTTYLQQRGKTVEWIAFTESFLPLYLKLYTCEQGNLDFVRNWTAQHVAGEKDAERMLAILMWYHYFNGDMDIATYLITLFGTEGVIESQLERLADLYGLDIAEMVEHGVRFPPLGSDILDYPSAVSSYLDSLKLQLPLDACRKVLAGNHHRLDPEQFAPEKDYFAQSKGLSDYLGKKHKRLVANLQEHCDTGKLWFEQVITQEVVDYVSQHQEIQTGILQGDSIIVRKIPYAPDAWLKESDPLRKRYLACHCPFVRSSIVQNQKVDSLWCYCTGGFTKLLFDYLFGEDLEVSLISSVLDGDESCTFSIKLPE